MKLQYLLRLLRLSQLVALLLMLAAPAAQAAISVVGSSSTGGGSSSTVSSLTLSNPGSQVGDVLLVQLTLNSAEFVSQPGWTSFIYDSNGVSQQLFYRVAGSSEPASYQFNFASTRAAGGLLLVRGASIGAGNPIVAAQSERGNSSTLTALSATVSVANSLVIRYFSLSNGNNAIIGPATQHYDAATGAGPNGVALSASSAIAPAAGQSGDATATTASGANWVSLTVVLAPITPPVVSWRMNESLWSGASGEVLDSSDNGLHGRAFNSATTNSETPALPVDSNGFGTCRYGEFSSANRSYLQAADNSLLDLNGSFTIGIWVRPISRPAQLMSIVSKDENYEFHLRPSGVVNWWWQTTAGTTLQLDSNVSVPLNSWTHVAIRFSPGAQTIFINGAPAGSAAFSGTPRTNTDPLQVGQDQGFAGRYFNGALDELRVYNRALSNAEVQLLTQERPAICATAPDHYELVYASDQGLTCNPLSVILHACQNSSCSVLYGDPVTVSLSPSGAPNNWSVTPLTFTGSTTVQFRRTTPATVTLGLIGTPVASNATQCIVGGVSGSCAVTFADSGFIFDVPNTLAAKPTSATLRAVRKDDQTQACVPGFASGTRTVAFSRLYSDPNTGTQPVLVNGTAVTSDTPVTLDFDANASAPLLVRYDDAGLMTLSASFSGSGEEAGLLMVGSDQFVSKPYGLLLETDTASSCTADINCPLYPAGVRAGDAFSLRVKAVAWQSDGEPLTVAELADNPVTPNFTLSNISLSSELVAPIPGSAGILSPNSYNHPVGNQASVSAAISEVGVFRLIATPTLSYHGETVAGGTSELVGRFIPAYLGATGSASLTPSCGSSFSYQGQPIEFAGTHEPLLTLSGYNRQGALTQNYDRGDFWRLAAPGVGSYSSTTGLAVDTRLVTQGAASLSIEGADDGDGARGYRWSGEQLLYTPGVLPVADDVPFMARVNQAFAAASLTDADGACYGAGAACQDFSYAFTDDPGSEVRLGRLRIGNAHGSELQALNLPLTVESWQATGLGNSFAPEGLDNCTAVLLGAPVLAGFTGSLAAGETTPSLSGPAAGVGFIGLTAPGAGNEGSVRGSFLPALPPTWLYYDWSGNGREMASGLATFGIYRGAPPLIFRRELYR